MHLIKHNKTGEQPEIIELPNKEIHAEIYGILGRVGLYQHGDSSMDIEADRIWLRKARIRSEETHKQVRKEIIGWLIKGVLSILALGLAAWGGKELW